MKNARFPKMTLMLFSAFILLALFGCAANAVVKHGYSVRVMLELPEGIVCASENPLYVEAGSPASFDVALGEDYALEKLSAGAVYADGKISLESVWLPVTVKPVVAKLTFYSVSARPSAGGAVAGALEKAPEGSLVTLSAEADDSHMFTGWTTGAPASEGGRTYSDESTVEIKAEADILLFANFSPAYTVWLVCGDGISAKNSFRKVPSGETAFFDLQYEPGWLHKAYVLTYRDETGAQLSVSDSPNVVMEEGSAVVSGLASDCTLTVSAYDSYLRTLKIYAENGNGAQTSASAFRYGSEAVVSAAPDSGYAFTGWSAGNYTANGGRLVSEDAEYGFSVTDDTVLYANFLKVYTVILKTDAGITSVEYSAQVLEGQSARFSLTFGRGFVYNSNDGGGYYANGVFAIDNISSSLTVSVTSLYTLSRTVTVHTSGGGAASGGGACEYGDSVTLTAAPNSGYGFAGWSSGSYLSSGGKLVSPGETYAFTVNENITLYANFLALHKVTVSCGAGISCEKTTYSVLDGQELKIKLTVAAGYRYESNSALAPYSDGHLVFPSVKSSFSVGVAAKEIKSYTVSALTSSSLAGSVSRSSFTAQEGSKIDLVATPKNGYQFLCWTAGASLEGYGTVISKKASFFHEVSSNMTLYANFGEANRAYMLYHANGGSISGSSRDVLLNSFSLKIYIYPNAIADLGTFVREGYTLLEYAETADGGGEPVNPGGKLVNYNGGLLELYAVWSKWTPAEDFTYSLLGDGNIRITGYKGNAEVLSIPGKINGNTVTSIASDAVRNKAFKTLVLPKTLLVVQDQAFINCMSCQKIYLCDSLEYISDKGFKDCRSFSTVCFNAATVPKFVYNRGYSQFRRFERFMKYIGQDDCLVIISGSSSLHGIDSKQMMDALAKAGYNYTVINFGTNMSNTSQFFMRLVYTFADKGDIVVTAPEYGGAQLGDRNFSDQFFVGFEYAYNMFRYADMSSFTNVFTAFNSFLGTKRSVNRVQTYEDYFTDYDEYVTYTAYRGTRPDDSYNAGVTMNYTAATLSTSRAQNLNEVYKLLQDKGIKVYMSFAPMNQNGYIGSMADAAAFEAAVDKNLLCPRISRIADYIFLPRYFHDSNYHLGTEGCAMRSAMLAGDIIAQLNKEAGK